MSILAKLLSWLKKLIDFFISLFSKQHKKATPSKAKHLEVEIIVPKKRRRPKWLSVEESWEFLTSITETVMKMPNNMQKMIHDVGIALAKMDVKYIHVIEYGKPMFIDSRTLSTDEKSAKRPKSSEVSR